MRHARATLAAAAVAAGSGIAVALFSLGRLADAPVRGRLGGPDPVGSVASAAALLIGIVAFYRLGSAMAPDAPTARPALVAGAAGGALAGLATSIAQSFALADYLSAVLAGYAVPPEFLRLALATYVVAATIAASLLAGGVSYAGWTRGRPAG